jgi:lysozyme family protein
MAHPYQELAAEYESWVANCRPRPEREHEIDQVARGLLRGLQHFDAIAAETGIPVVVMATICHREYGENGAMFNRNPAQGDPLTHPSTHVPAGRPPSDHWPVTWEVAALDAFTVCDRLNVNSAPWSLPYACWKWEYYNGGGSRAHGIRTPYVVGGTNLQQRGKYVSDHNWDPTAMDQQLGCLPIAMRMIELEPRLAFGEAVEPAAEPAEPEVAAAPPAVGAHLTGVKWVQASLNVVENLDAPLTVDGSFGRLTRAAVRKFQQEHGMPDTGYVDEAFCAAMDAALAANRPAT